MKQKKFIKLTFILPILIFSLILLPTCQTKEARKASNLRFEISFTEEQCKEPLDGRILLMISTNDDREPRFQISDGPNTQQIFGIDINGMKPGEEEVIDESVFGYPMKNLSEIPSGDYWVQALIHRYETFHRADGHTVKLPMDRGEGQHWNRAPGNLFSTPEKVFIDPGKMVIFPIHSVDFARLHQIRILSQCTVKDLAGKDITKLSKSMPISFINTGQPQTHQGC